MPLRLVSYAPEFKRAFIDLNKAWLEEFFSIEPQDEYMFDNLESAILANGAIFFLLQHHQPIGTVAMIQTAPGTYELAKMAIHQAHRGYGYGKWLMEAALAYATAQEAKKIYLLSNRRLLPALALYRKFGFIEAPLPASNYTRADIYMELQKSNNNE